MDSCRIGDEGLVHLSGDCYLRFLLFITDISVFKNITLMWVLGMLGLKSLELSDTEVGSHGLRHLSGKSIFPFLCPFHFVLSIQVYTSVLILRILCCYVIGLLNLESINLSFTVVTDSGLRKLSGLTSLRTLNLDARHVTDAGLSALTSKSNNPFASRFSP